MGTPACVISAAAVFLLVTVAEVRAAEGDPAHGKTVAQKYWCYRCHGATGQSANPHIPILAGQQPNYIKIQILYFQQDPPSGGDGTKSYRTHRSMGYNARRLRQDEIADIAAYYASQTCHRSGDPIEAPPPPVTVIEECTQCHGEDGFGRFDQVPNLAGQNRLYLLNQLLHFAGRDEPGAGDRRRHPIMNRIAAGLTDDEIASVATHFANMDCR
ncbi:MAG: c-type cytochrome [Rhodospirillales bacterium]